MAYDPSDIIGSITQRGAIGDAGNAVGMDRSDAYGYLYQYFCQFFVLDEIRIKRGIIKQENRPMVMIIGRFFARCNAEICFLEDFCLAGLGGAIKNGHFASNSRNCFACTDPFSLGVGISIHNILHFDDVREGCTVQGTHSYGFRIHL